MQNIKLCSGFGQYHSDSPKDPKATAKPFGVFSLAELPAMMESPPQVEKSQAQWVIFSDLIAGGRSADRQRKQGRFYALWADLDENQGKAIGDIIGALMAIVGSNTQAFVYTSKSATSDNPKARIIVPLSEPVSGVQFEQLQQVFNDKLKLSGIEPDRKTETANQVCYLPNRGEYYDKAQIGEQSFNAVAAWGDDLAKLEAEEKQRQERLKQQRAESLRKAQERQASGQFVPIDSFNQAHDVCMMLEFYGYKKQGGRYLSPLSESGAAGVSVKGDKWISSHGSDLASGIGAISGDGKTCYGDAFDLYAFYEHNNDRKAATKAVADMLDPEGQQQRQRDYMAEKSQQEALAMLDSLDYEQEGIDPAQFEKIKAVFNAKLEQQAQQSAANDDLYQWPKPVDFLLSQALPVFDVELVPSVIGDYAKAIAPVMGIDAGGFCLAALSVCASALGDEFKIQPKKHEHGFTVAPRLWFALLADPSMKKTPLLKAATKPFKKLGFKEGEHNERIKAEYLEQVKKHKRLCQKAEKEGEEEPEPLEKPDYKPRLCVEDITVEALGSILNDTNQKRGVMVFRDELSGWLGSMDAYKSSAGKDKPAWLEFYNGGAYSIDRVTRGSLFVQNWGGNIIGGIQPKVIAEKGILSGGDGLIQRFVVYQPNQVEYSQDKPVEVFLETDYQALIEGLYSLQPNGRAIRLDDEAQAARNAFTRQVEQWARNMPNDNLMAAIGKWEGQFAAMLLVYHAIDCQQDSVFPSTRPVPLHTVQKVEALFKKILLPHLLALYDNADSQEDSTKHIAKLILAKHWERFTLSNLSQNDSGKWRTFKPWEQKQVLDRLEAYGWIMPENMLARNNNGIPKAYKVNPELHKVFADVATKEQQKRKEQAEIINAMKAHRS